MTARKVGAAARVAPAARPPADDEPRQTWYCRDCGAIFHAWAPAERHCDTRGHYRIVWKI